MTKKHFLGLELLRFGCSLAILLWHYQHFFEIGPNQMMPGFERGLQPFYSGLKFFYEHGHAAVLQFFVISGFIFFWKYSADIHEARVGARQFFILRFSRLYPLHAATLVVVAIGPGFYRNETGHSFIYHHNDGYHFLLNVFFASHWGFQEGYSFNAPIWSVSLEVIAYALFFVLAMLFRLTVSRIVMIVAALFVLHRYGGANDLIVCLQYFFVGGIVFEMVKVLIARDARLSLFVSALWAFGAALVIWMLPGSLRAEAFVFLAAGIVAVAASVSDPAFRGLLGKLAPELGNLTYALYLCHFPVQLLFVLSTEWLLLGRDVFLRPSLLAAYAATVLVTSWLAYRFYEMPAQSRIRAMLLVPKPSVKAIANSRA